MLVLFHLSFLFCFFIKGVVLLNKNSLVFFLMFSVLLVLVFFS